MLKITLTGGPQFVEKLKAKGPTIAEILRSKLNALMFMLSNYIVSQKLSGQVLHRRTGILAGSIRTIPASFEGTSIVAGVEGAGGPAFYGRMHEFGGTGPYQIIASKARVLAFMLDGKKVFAKYVTHPAAKARPFMATSLAENAENIKAELQAALDAEVAKP